MSRAASTAIVAQTSNRTAAHLSRLLEDLPLSAGLVTVIDGSAGALSWLGGVRGQRVCPLGVDDFGQVGDLTDLYAHYRLDVDAIVEACAGLFLQ